MENDALVVRFSKIKVSSFIAATALLAVGSIGVAVNGYLRLRAGVEWGHFERIGVPGLTLLSPVIVVIAWLMIRNVTKYSWKVFWVQGDDLFVFDFAVGRRRLDRSSFDSVKLEYGRIVFYRAGEVVESYPAALLANKNEAIAQLQSL